MQVMKDRNAKACRGFVRIKPMNDWDSERLFGFPNGCEEGHKPGVWKLLERRPRAWSSSPAPCPGRTRNGSRSQCYSLSSAWEERSPGVPGRWIWKPESHPVAIIWFRGKAISQEGFSPREGERWFPCSPLSLTETKTRLNISANIIYRNLS